MDEDTELDPTDRWFAANLKAAREQAGVSQEQVARRMREHGFPGFRQQTMGRIEAGERAVRVGEALALARAVESLIEDLTRPPGLARDALVLRGATGHLLELRDEAAKAARLEAGARARLGALVARLRGEGKAEALAGEIGRAERALALPPLAATVSDDADGGPGAVAGPSQNVQLSEVTSDTVSM